MGNHHLSNKFMMLARIQVLRGSRCLSCGVLQFFRLMNDIKNGQAVCIWMGGNAQQFGLEIGTRWEFYFQKKLNVVQILI